MKGKILLALVMAVGTVAFAEETKPVDPNPFSDFMLAMKSTDEHPFAVDWSRKHDKEIADATAPEVLEKIASDAEKSAELLGRLKGAYGTDPVVMTQIGAVTQWVMLPDPWYCLFWNGAHGSARDVWIAALKDRIARTTDAYVRTFCRQQLDWCERRPTRVSRRMPGKWCSLGTSITWYNDNVKTGGGRFSRGYQDCVRDVLAFDAFSNRGVNGGVVESQFNALEKADWYTIEHGINDWGHSVRPGTIEDYVSNASNRTFAANYRILIDRIRALNPDAKIILCTPRRGYGFGTYLPKRSTEPKNGIYLEDYAKVVREIAAHEGFPVADFFANCGEDDELAALSIEVALHPNDAGYQRMADELIRAFEEAE